MGEQVLVHRLPLTKEVRLCGVSDCDLAGGVQSPVACVDRVAVAPDRRSQRDRDQHDGQAACRRDAFHRACHRQGLDNRGPKNLRSGRPLASLHGHRDRLEPAEGALRGSPFRGSLVQGGAARPRGTVRAERGRQDDPPARSGRRDEPPGRRARLSEGDTGRAARPAAPAREADHASTSSRVQPT